MEVIEWLLNWIDAFKQEDDEEEEEEEEEEYILHSSIAGQLEDADEEEEEEEDDEEEGEEEEAFAKRIEKLISKEHARNGTNINYHSYIEIDGLPVDIFVKKEEKNKEHTYKFSITIAGNIICLDKPTTKQLHLLVWDEFDTVQEVLKQIKIVKRDYKLIDHYLLSPSEIKYVNMQRTFFQIPTDNHCSVCNLPTKEYTICRHPICFRCRYKCIVSNNHTCPICRTGELKRFPNELIILDVV
jgi:hypothetical protein